MFHHVAAFTFKPTVTPEDIDNLTRDLQALAADLEGVVSYACGSDLRLREGSDSYAVAAVFDSADALTSYLNDPRHLEIVRTQVRAMVGEKHSVQFATA